MTSVSTAIIGMGFMGRTHARSYHAAAAAGYPCSLRWVCDPDASRLDPTAPVAGNLGSGEGPAWDVSSVRATTSVDEVLSSDIDLVSICTHTDSHVGLALRALAAGKHVLLEKPVAVNAAEVRRLADAARDAGTLIMPAMCMRFWPGWDWLRDRVRDGSLGTLRSATFQRLGSGPSWAAEFYQNTARSGGALIDLHIHDADFIHWCFGPPAAVSSTGGPMHVSTHYHYPDGPSHITAEGAWDLAPGAGFRMKYLANFERGSAEFDIASKTPLVLHTNESPQSIELPTSTGYDGQVRHLVSLIAEGRRDLIATLDQAAAVAAMLEAEATSARERRIVNL
ncbi:MAG: Gfo/Idh/MocA family oxidoreductase [Phycisphaerae bacterium]|nr:Gfo/Idh/MocA family oxidoreductase [Phycisphaerae bacterium]